MIKSLLKFLHPRFQNLFLEYPVEFKPRYGHGKPPHQELYHIIDVNRAIYENMIDTALSLKEKIWEIVPHGEAKSAKDPTWNNGFLPGLDVIAIYTLLSKYKPRNYIEIGSGNSTKVAYKAKMDQKLDCKIVSIDPQPRAEIDELADEVIRARFEDTDLDLISRLGENDILFIDNSHRILPNSDSMVFYMEILPQLKKGVIVHIHDIYLPYDYPQFMCDRFYSEQYGLAIFLMANPVKYKTLFPNYFVSEDSALSAQMAPIWNHAHLKNVERHGGSFWLQIN